MLKFKDLWEDMDDFKRKMTGRLSKNDAALRLAKSEIERILRDIQDLKKKRLTPDQFSQLVSQYEKDLRDAAVAIRKAGGKG